MDIVVLLSAAVLLVEIPWSMRSAWRVSRRYRARLRDNRLFKFLAVAALWIAFVGGGLIGALVLYALGRTAGVVPDLGRGVVPLLLTVGLVALLAFPIALERVLARIATTPDHTDQDDVQEVP